MCCLIYAKAACCVRCLHADWCGYSPKIQPTKTCAVQTPIDNLAWQPDSYFASAPANATATCEENNVAWLPEDFWVSGWENYRQAAAAALSLFATRAGTDCEQLTALMGDANWDSHSFCRRPAASM